MFVKVINILCMPVKVVAEYKHPELRSLGMSFNQNLIVASNRGPGINDNAKYASGGLVQVLLPELLNIAEHLQKSQSDNRVFWICGNREDETDEISTSEYKIGEISLAAINIPTDIYNDAYNSISNRFLWFLHHGLFDFYPKLNFDDIFFRAWENYRKYNRLFAEHIARIAPSDSSVLIQDYHLSLAPQMLAEIRSDVKISHFSHTPFAKLNDLKQIPRAIAEELLRGINSLNTKAGFHTPIWESRFKEAYKFYLHSVPDTFNIALGVDPKSLEAVKASDSFKTNQDSIRKESESYTLIVRSDRLEPSKNILAGFNAFEKFLENNPKYLEKVIFKAYIYPSRTEIPEYFDLSKKVVDTVNNINSKYETPSWIPIHLHIQNDRDVSLAGLSVADIVMVNPIADGLNLVVKEAIVLNENDCVIILSKNAGAFYELKDFVIGVDPEDIKQTSEAILTAVNSNKVKSSKNLKLLKQLCIANDADVWFRKLISISTKQKS